MASRTRRIAVWAALTVLVSIVVAICLLWPSQVNRERQLLERVQADVQQATKDGGDVLAELRKERQRIGQREAGTVGTLEQLPAATAAADNGKQREQLEQKRQLLELLKEQNPALHEAFRRDLQAFVQDELGRAEDCEERARRCHDKDERRRWLALAKRARDTARISQAMLGE